MKSLKRILIAATLLVSLVGAAGTASADTGVPTTTAGAAPSGIIVGPVSISWE